MQMQPSPAQMDCVCFKSLPFLSIPPCVHVRYAAQLQDEPAAANGSKGSRYALCQRV
jgi:hypothetical protein